MGPYGLSSAFADSLLMVQVFGQADSRSGSVGYGYIELLLLCSCVSSAFVD